MEIGKQLARLGVDICEAGFPIASQGDFDAVTRVAQTAGCITEGRPSGQPMRIAGLARANEKDIERCYNAVKHAPLHRIHTFLASSDIHLEHKLGISRQECLETSSKMVAFAKTLVDDIEFSPEDAGRSDPEFLIELCAAVIEAGATTINLPDTVGYTLPSEYANLFAYLIEKTPTGGRDVVWSTHCHNDLGLATANSLAAVQSGARQVEVTLNSLGERAGNTSLEEVVMALRTRPQHFPVYCDIDTRQIMRASKMVAAYTGIFVQPNKAIVGANAFAHESGIHQHGVLAHAATYEIMTPESVGIEDSQDGRGSLVLGKHSGKAAYRQRLIELGYADIAADKEQLAKSTPQPARAYHVPARAARVVGRRRRPSSLRRASPSSRPTHPPLTCACVCCRQSWRVPRRWRIRRRRSPTRTSRRSSARRRSTRSRSGSSRI